MARQGLSGQYGSMPEDELLKKMETTCLPFDDSTQIYDYHRQMLKDESPDGYIFDEHVPSKTRGRSAGVLTLRSSGKRNSSEAYLPDGLFLDHEFLGDDGIKGQPNMRKHYDQQMARAKFVKKYNDNDHSVVESGWNPVRAVTEIKHQMYNVAKRMNIFDTSVDNSHTGGVGVYKRTSQRGKVSADGKILDIAGAGNFNRGNATNKLSKTGLGWRRQADHKFKVSKYGLKRKHMNKSKLNLHHNRGTAELDHEVIESKIEQTNNKAIVVLMEDIIRERLERQKTADNMVKGTSREQQQHTRRITPEEVQTMFNLIAATQPITPNVALSDNYLNKNGTRLLAKDHNNIEKIVFTNPEIVKFMASINKKMGKQDISDLRENIQQTHDIVGILNMADKNMYRSQNHQMPGLQSNWQSKDFRAKTGSYNAHVYTSAPLPTGESKLQNTNFEAFRGVSYDTHGNKQLAGRNNRSRNNDTAVNHNVGNELTYSRHGHGMGDKTKVRMNIETEYDPGINEL